MSANYSPDATVDQLMQFVKALNFSQGDWMGEYCNTTLIKGCFFPIFLGAAIRLGINYVFAIQVFYVIACLFCIYCFQPIIRNRVVIACFLTLLLFNPISTSAVAAETYRVSIYFILSFCAVSAVCGSALRITSVGCSKYILIAVCGLFYGLAINTREDSQWLTAFLVTAMLVMAIVLITKRYRSFKKLIALFFSLAVFVCIPSLVISLKNYKEYGIFITEDYNSGAFAEAYGALTRPFGSNEYDPHYPIPEDVREVLYEKSPSFAQLEYQLEDGRASAWKAYGNNDFSNGWVSYALRDAAEDCGYYCDAQTAAAFWQSVADEVNALCDSGEIAARGRRSGIAAPFDKAYLKDILTTTVSAVKNAYRFAYVTPLAEYFEADKSYIDNIEGVLNCPINAYYINDYGKAMSRVNMESAGYNTIITVNKVFSLMFGVLFPLSLAGLVYIAVVRARRIKTNGGRLLRYLLEIIIPLSLLVLLTARCFMLAYVDVTGYSAILKPSYMSDTYIISELFTLVVLSEIANDGAAFANKRTINRK